MVALAFPASLSTQSDGSTPQDCQVPEVSLIEKGVERGSLCTLVVDGRTAWSVETPELIMQDWNSAGYLVGAGTAYIAYGGQEKEAVAMFVVNPDGEFELLEAHMPIGPCYPHGGMYPIVLGVHAFSRNAIFRLYPGPGVEQWWNYSLETGALLNGMDPTKLMVAAFQEKYMSLTEVAALQSADMLAVLAAPVAELVAHQNASTASFGGTALALIALGKGVVWQRQSPSGSYFLKGIHVQAVGRDAYEVEMKCMTGQAITRKRLRCQVNAAGSWEPQGLEWP